MMTQSGQDLDIWFYAKLNNFVLRMPQSTQLLELREKIRAQPNPDNHKPDRQTRKLLMYLFTSTRGGFTRLRIVELLLNKPLNAHQMSQELKLDYKAIQHHMRVLEKNNLVSKMGERYGAIYHISNFLEYNIGSLDEAIEKLERKLNLKKVYI